MIEEVEKYEGEELREGGRRTKEKKKKKKDEEGEEEEGRTRLMAEHSIRSLVNLALVVGSF